jgi:hypothetical protein
METCCDCDVAEGPSAKRSRVISIKPNGEIGANEIFARSREAASANAASTCR